MRFPRATNLVFGFEHQGGARRFLGDLEARMRKFGLTLHPEKTRLIEFGRFAVENRKRRGLGKPETFDFLGFTYMCGTTYPMKRFIVRRKTVAKRLRNKLREVKELLRAKLHDPIDEVGKWLGAVVQGHMNYYAVPGNINSIDSFKAQVTRHWLRSLRRRSQRHRMHWGRFRHFVDKYLPKSRVVHPYPYIRFHAIHSK